MSIDPSGKGRLFLHTLKRGKGDMLIHWSVKERWGSDLRYRPHNVKQYIAENGWTGLVD